MVAADLGSTLKISLFELLREEFGDELPLLRCTKATLVHLSHTLEDLVLTQNIPALLFTGFQESSHWREETERYRALAEVAQQVCIFAGGELPAESEASQLHVTLQGEDPLRQEWFLVLLCSQFTVLLCGQDQQVPAEEEAIRQFDTIWTFDPAIINRVLDLLERVVAHYRPERLESLKASRQMYPPQAPDPQIITRFTAEMIRFEEQLHHALHNTTAMLKEQLRWREDLTTTLVHDMRTPIQSLVLSIDMLENLEEFDVRTIRHMLQIAKRGARGLEEMVQLVLDTNQLATGRFNIAWQPLRPEQFVQEAVRPLQALIDSNNIAFSVEVDPCVSVIWGDHSLLMRVLQNLVGNAIKYSQDHGHVDIAIAQTPNGDRIEIHVRDTGQGIPSSDLPYVFDRYYQVRSTMHKGNGLGLYFCRLACEAHNGAIRAASQIGKGTTMTMVLPANPEI